jgi:ubiquinone/menaquinone biosynthesis C-methylase UbiE
MNSTNVYQDQQRASSYAKLEFPGTYYLAFRDLAEILSTHSEGNIALDFGCGAGRSTRFLKEKGYQVKGIDISHEMVNLAYESDPEGDYQIIKNGILNGIPTGRYDIILSAFTFDNIPGYDNKVNLFNEFHRVLKPGGIMVNLVSSPELYSNDWASFSTREFPSNKTAKCGDKVYTIMLDVDDRRPVADIFWPPEDYKKVYHKANLEQVQVYKPLAYPHEPYDWVNETSIAPWTIYVLKKTGK